MSPNLVRNGAADGAKRSDIEHIHDEVLVPFIPIAYQGTEESAVKLATALRPEWSGLGNNIEFVRFTDGITNTLMKVVNQRQGFSDGEIDREAFLLRAYGHGTDVLIDRRRETQNHELLMKFCLAPQLLARFENGMLYRFIRGCVTHPNDLRRPAIYRAVARRLAEWHARVPCIPETRKEDCANSTGHTNGVVDGYANGTPKNKEAKVAAINRITPGTPVPNVWTVMQKWIFALPTETEAQKSRQAHLQKELERLVSELSQRHGLGKNGVSTIPTPAETGTGSPTPEYCLRNSLMLERQIKPARVRSLRPLKRQHHRPSKAWKLDNSRPFDRRGRNGLVHRLRVRRPVPCSLRSRQPLRRVGWL